ncbi:MAG: LysR substrate-binding domain-containing protein [Moraxellaceae bacterium]|nr:LysR substrate-binding domain-containing protein [Moraxellaceae bacterium]
MTLTDLRYLIALARERHFGRAADTCHVSQPTLSIAIKKVEDELGIALFERHRHEVLVTPGGETIITQAQRVLDEMDVLNIAARAARNEFAEPLKLGAIFTVAPDLFPPLVRALKTGGSGLMLYLEENYTHVLAEKLASGLLDAIIVAEPFEPPETHVEPLYHESFELLMPSDHAWAKKKSVDGATLQAGELMLLGEGHCFRDQVLEACPHLAGGHHGGQHNMLGAASSLSTLRHMVSSGLGLTLVPASASATLTEGGDVITRPLSPAPERTIVLAWRRRFPRPQAIAALFAALRGLHLPGTQAR